MTATRRLGDAGSGRADPTGASWRAMPSDRERIEALIARVALRDRAAFADLYDATSGKLFAVCLRVLGRRNGAEDALQEIYVKIWNNADRYRVTGHSPMTWLITIARNAAIDHLRAHRDDREMTDDIADHGGAFADAGPSPEQSAIATSEAARIRDCMDALPADRRDAIIGVYLDGRTYAELAERFGVPLNTMRTWLRRGLIALRECLEQ